MAKASVNIGQRYLYKTREHTVKNVSINADGLFIVETDKTTLKLTSEEVLRDLLPIASEGNSAALAVLRQELEPQAKLAGILMDTIGKIQADPKYIDQARAINEQAKTLVEIGKLQVDMVRIKKEIL